METAFIDFETRSTVDLRRCGADVYARHPDTSVLCLGYAFGDEPAVVWRAGSPAPDRLLDHVAKGGHAVGHNIGGFEVPVWTHGMAARHGWPALRVEQCTDTMCMSFAMSLPGALERAAAAVGLDVRKDMVGHRTMLQLCKPRDTREDGTPVWWTQEEYPEKYERLFEYCKTDIDVERELYKRLRTLSPQEQNLWHIDQRINQRGIAVDLKAVDAAMAIADAERKRLDKEMRRVTGNAVASCSAVSQLTDWLRWQGVDVNGVAKADVLELLESGTVPCKVCGGSGFSGQGTGYGDVCSECGGQQEFPLPDACRTALLLRQEAAKSSTKKLEAMRHGVCDDGRIRGLFQYHGASTGRWAGRRIQVHNLPRPKLSQKEIDQVFEILGGVE